jgi:hypothetical protein
MAASMTSEFTVSVSTPAPATARVQCSRPRRITPQAGRALEILGHAIEYLTDECVHHGAAMIPGNPQLEAVQLLMALNRQIYFECPETPTLRQRFRAAFNLRAAA